MSHSVRNSIVTGALALAGAAAAAAPAGAAEQSATLQYKCKYPLIDIQPVTLRVRTTLPTVVDPETPFGPSDVWLEFESGENTSEFLPALNGAKIEGSFDVRASLTFPSGTKANFKFGAPIAPYQRPAVKPPTVLLSGQGKTPVLSIPQEEVGRTTAQLEVLNLNLRALKADGSVINVKKLPTDIYGNPVFDSDGDPDTFDVYCKPDVAPAIFAAIQSPHGDPFGPPTKVTGEKVDFVTPSSVKLSWAPSVDFDGGEVAYNVYRNGVKVATVSGTSFEDRDLAEDTTYAYAIEATDGTDAAEKTFITAKTYHDDNIPPLSPGEGVYNPAVDFAYNAVTVRWTASDASCGLKGYVVVFNGQEYEVPAGQLYRTFTGLEPATEYRFEIYAVDHCGNRSEANQEVLSTVEVPPNQPPTAPTALRVSTVASTSATIVWNLSTDDRGIAGYNVYCDGVKRNSALLLKPIFEVTGLTPGVAVVCHVEAVDTDGLATKSNAIAVKVTPPVVYPPNTLAYDAKGTTTLNTLTKGTLPLLGGLVVATNPETGAFSGDLKLNNTNGRLISGGWLPITAKLQFVPVGKTTGKLDAATDTSPAAITTHSKVRIKVLVVQLFGAIPLAGGNNCQTKTPSDITLKSTGAFDPAKGGTIAGTYAISDLNGCGGLTGLVSPMTAGGGNTMSLDLTRKG